MSLQRSSSHTVRTAEVRFHNGAPTFFLDGQPEFLSLLWVVRPTADHWGHAEESWPLPREGHSDTAQRTAATGLFLYTFDVGREWCGPGPGRTDPYDFSDLAGCLRSSARFAVVPVAAQRELGDEWD